MVRIGTITCRHEEALDMELKCHICGRTVEVETWTEEYQRLKESIDPAFICDACQEKIRIEARQDQRP